MCPGDLRHAALKHDPEQARVLTYRLEDAEAARNRLRKAISHYKEFAHGQAAQ